ncbi:sigma-70 family RNA polymerase sigma factor family protein [Flindersiella endophytica]
MTVIDDDFLAGRFEAHRTHLRAVAYRMLGSQAEADDAVQEAWLRLHRTDSAAVDNLGGWLTTVVARISLDMLRTRKSRREDPLEVFEAPDAADREAAGPEQQALLADSVGLALLVVLDTLPPAERLAYVLHDMFAVPFDEIAPIVDRTPAAARQLASRARRRIQAADTRPDTDLTRQRAIVAAFLDAAHNGDFEALLAMLDPDVVLRPDAVTLRYGAQAKVGAHAVAGTFTGRARGAQLALINGIAGAAWTVDGRSRIVFTFTIAAGKIVAIDLTGDPDSLARLAVTPLAE